MPFRISYAIQSQKNIDIIAKCYRLYFFEMLQISMANIMDRKAFKAASFLCVSGENGMIKGNIRTKRERTSQSCT